MATARPGWSRRAQYGLFFSLLAVIAGIIVGLALLTVSIVSPRTFEDIRGGALNVTGPIAGSLHEVTATVSGPPKAAPLSMSSRLPKCVARRRGVWP